MLGKGSGQEKILLGELQRAIRLLDIVSKLPDSEKITALLNNFKEKSTVEIGIERLLNSTLEAAIQEYNLELVKGILNSNYPLDPNRMALNETHSLLGFAISCNNSPEMIEFLISKGANVNDNKSVVGFSPVHLACIAQNKAVLKVLVKHGANVHGLDNLGYPPSALFVYRDSIEMLQWLDDEFDLNFHQLPEATTLHLACRHRAKKIMQWLLLEKKMDVDQPDQYGLTPLDYAIVSGSAEMVALLLKHGAEVNRSNNSGGTPFTTALEQAGNKIQNMLLAHPTFDIAVKGVPYLQLAVKRCHISIVKELIKRGSDINEKDEEGKSPLCTAICASNFKAAKYLISLNADLTVVDNLGRDALYYAMWADSAVLTKLIIERFMRDFSPQDKKLHMEKLFEIAKNENKRRVTNYLLQEIADLTLLLDRDSKEKEKSKDIREEPKIVEPFKKEEAIPSSVASKSKKRRQRAKLRKSKNEPEKIEVIVEPKMPETTWLKGLVTQGHIGELDNHDGYRFFIAKQSLEEQAGKSSDTLNSLLQLKKMRHPSFPYQN